MTFRFDATSIPNTLASQSSPAHSRDEKLALLDVSLTRAADVLGDITDHVMALFYDAYPEARTSFEGHGLGDRRKLEAQMVENVVYCLMTWIERPDEIEMIFLNSVPHHQETLMVNNDWYSGMVIAAIETIAATIGPHCDAERRLWEELRTDLCAAIKRAIPN